MKSISRNLTIKKNGQTKIKKFFVFNLLFFTLCMSSNVAYAGVAVNPTVTEISVAPEETFQGVYTVINTADDEMIVTIEFVDWMEHYFKKENDSDVNSWLTLEEKEVSLLPGAYKKIPYTVTVPLGIEEEQVAQIFFEFKSKQHTQMMRTRLGVIFYLGIKGKEKLFSTIEKIVMKSNKNPDGTYNVQSTLVINNLGNVHIRPFGTVHIKNEDTSIGVIEIKPGKGIYPMTVDTIHGTVNNLELKTGTYEALAEVNCGMYGIENTITKKIKFVIEG
ncbi:MAG: hypothetical protein KKH94_09050 [Candidatus Omnitrophica bacterium]|nr:hypothetical protein [Candidatus Omnitrophota bacterium]